MVLLITLIPKFRRLYLTLGSGVIYNMKVENPLLSYFSSVNLNVSFRNT